MNEISTFTREWMLMRGWDCSGLALGDNIYQARKGNQRWAVHNYLVLFGFSNAWEANTFNDKLSITPAKTIKIFPALCIVLSVDCEYAVIRQIVPDGEGATTSCGGVTAFELVVKPPQGGRVSRSSTVGAQARTK